MKTIFLFLLFAGNIYAQNTQMSGIVTFDNSRQKEANEIINHLYKVSISDINKPSIFKIKNDRTNLISCNGVNSLEFSSQSSSKFPIAFGIGPSFIVGFNDKPSDKYKKEIGVGLFLNAGKKISENFLIKSEFNFSYNSYYYKEEYKTINYYGYYENYFEDVHLIRFNLFINGIYGFFNLGKYMIYAFAGIGIGFNSESISHNGYNYSDKYLNPLSINYGIGGGRRISKNFALTCDFMFDSRFLFRNRNTYFTPRIGLSFNM